jgi:toxin ParE1/3/4
VKERGTIEHTVSLLLEHPGLGSPTVHGKRRVLMRRFPFALIYAVVDDEVRILAVAHASRRPGYWSERD